MEEQPISLRDFFMSKLEALAMTTELARSALASNTEAARLSLEKTLDLSRIAQEKLMIKLEQDIKDLRESRAAAEGGVSRTTVNVTLIIAIVAALAAVASLFLHR